METFQCYLRATIALAPTYVDSYIVIFVFIECVCTVFKVLAFLIRFLVNKWQFLLIFQNFNKETH